MGQTEIMEFLAKDKRKWFRGTEIAEGTGVEITSVTMACKRLRKHNLVKWDEERTQKGIKYYIYKFKSQ